MLVTATRWKVPLVFLHGNFWKAPSVFLNWLIDHRNQQRGLPSLEAAPSTKIPQKPLNEHQKLYTRAF
ncbi:hypothetical protein AMTR_s00072p00172660 [Amborella trichopoda]|uniref:Uncharacterized protein n=1 Tax=Amborella trichopoda TaxID=13333 RepID=W1NUZ7_AMBTC|nr:hypothetical protein AMTR_s00072p00172660 [Amborella trichopoda]